MALNLKRMASAVFFYLHISYSAGTTAGFGSFLAFVNGSVIVHYLETMQEEKLSYSETCRRFEVNSRDRIKSWERIYLEEGPEGFAVERRGRSSKGRPPKQLPKQVEEDLLAEVQRLRAENDYLKNLQALVLEDERRQHKKRW